MPKIYFSQQSLVQKMLALGYSGHKGRCHGISYMALQAFQAEQTNRFANRLQAIHNLSAQNIHNIKQNRLDFITKLPNNQSIVSHDLYAFLDGVELYQNPVNFDYVFPNDKPLRAIYYPARPIVCSQKFEKKNERIVQVKKYSNSLNLKELSSQIELLSKELTVRTSFILTSSNHSINLNYEPLNKTWLLVDANKLPFLTFKSPILLAKAIIAAFNGYLNGPSIAVFASQVFTKEKYKEKLQNDFKRVFSNKLWKKNHSLSGTNFLRKDLFNSSLIHAASIINQSQLIKSIFNKTDFINHPNYEGNYPIHFSAMSGHINSCLIILNKDISNLNLLDQSGHNLINIAVRIKSKQLLNLLLKKGAQPNPIPNQIRHPLNDAIVIGHHEMLKMLLDAGAKVYCRDIEGSSPLEFSTYLGKIDFLKQLLKAHIPIKLRKSIAINLLLTASCSSYNRFKPETFNLIFKHFTNQLFTANIISLAKSYAYRNGQIMAFSLGLNNFSNRYLKNALNIKDIHKVYNSITLICLSNLLLKFSNKPIHNFYDIKVELIQNNKYPFKYDDFQFNNELDPEKLNKFALRELLDIVKNLGLLNMKKPHVHRFFPTSYKAENQNQSNNYQPERNNL